MDRAYIEGCHDSIAPCAGLQGALEDGEKGGGASQRKAYSVEEWRSLLAVRYTCVRISFGTEGMWRPEREKQCAFRIQYELQLRCTVFVGVAS